MNDPLLKRELTQVHFIGIGGVGMSGLATILLERGVRVSGSDEADSAVLERLRFRGAVIASGHRPGNVPAAVDLVVYSSAVPATNPELQEAVRRGIPTCLRGEFLARLATNFPAVVSIAGSHGKTTTSAMIAHILRESGRRPGFLVGGDVIGWAAPASAGAGLVLVTEVDESDGTQALMRSSHAVITNVDDDHCWSLGGVEALEQCFVQFAESAERVFAWDDPTLRRLCGGHAAINFVGADRLWTELRLAVPGEHNRRNAALAVAVSEALAVPRAAALAAIATFPGVSRRLSERYCGPGRREVVVEDYAHHPVELRASLQALREHYPGMRLTAVFQPHRYERVKRYAAEFARVLEEMADEVVITAPFAAWRQDQALADPRQIADAIQAKPARFWDRPLEELAERLAGPLGDAAAAADPCLFAVIGAGDVGRLAGLLRVRLAERELARLEAELGALFTGCEPPRVTRERPWSELTTLGVGLAKPLLVRPHTQAELRSVLALARRRGVPVQPLGVGSNLVGCDWEPPRVWVQLRQGEFAEIAGQGEERVVGAGVTLAHLIAELRRAAALPVALAPLGWIPGTLGGALQTNAGAHGSCIGDFVIEAYGVCPDGTPWRGDREALGLVYRASNFPAGVLVTAVRLRLPAADVTLAEQAYRESGERRRESQPAGRSAGCVFRNPTAGVSAGQLLDRAGCKEWRQGHCQVSDRHANFILTDGPATEKDFVQLLLRLTRQVQERTGVRLMTEVKLVGTEAQETVRAQVPVRHVVVLKGGPSSERAVSLRSGAAVAQALREGGYRVTEVDVTKHELPPLPAKLDVVFPVFHGEFGEDGQIQRLLDAQGIRYVGSGAAASQLIMDKRATKDALVAHGLPTPRYVLLSGADAPPPAELRFPVVVKPVNQGSTIGISKVTSVRGGWWRRALKKAFALDTVVIAEEFVAGREITVGLLDGKALPVVEIVPPKGRMFDYDAKYDHKYGHTRYLCPPQFVSVAEQAKAQAMAERIFRAVGAKDLLRLDFIVDAAGTPWCLEGNAIPGFTATSLLPKAAQAAGISFVELCCGLVNANL